MNIFNKIMPWFIPTKEDQRSWYRDELRDNPKEVNRLLAEFQELSKEYNHRLGDFESELATTDLYEKYLDVKVLAQKVNFIWNRIEYKTKREQDLQEMLRDLNK